MIDKSAYVIGMAAGALIEAYGMKAENDLRVTQGGSPAYGEKEFFALIEKWGVHHNALLSQLQD
ncbi:MAG: hypothetical protein WCY49_07095 [Anaerovoracaceae bacterium]